MGLLKMLVCAALVVVGAAYACDYAHSRKQYCKAFGLIACGLFLFCYFI